jgi:hypothetical protein
MLKADPGAPRAATMIVAVLIAVILGASLWYLARPQPLIGRARLTRPVPISPPALGCRVERQRFVAFDEARFSGGSELTIDGGVTTL